MTAESGATGLRKILIATAIAGVLGYAIQLLAPALLKDDDAYITFSVYWSTLYLCVAALSGVQQEITRASRPVTDEPPSRVLHRFTWIAIGTVVLVVGVLAVLLGDTVLPGQTLLLAVALNVGVVGYLLVATLSGVLYGLQLWSTVARLTIIDACLRAVLVLAGFALGWPPEWIAFAVSVPFGLAFLIVWLSARRTVVGAFRLDVALRRLLVHASATVLAASAMGLMMNGLPMLLGVTARGSDPAVLAGLILAITLTRAPIVIPLLALQSYLISIFRGGGRELLRRILLALGLAAAGIAVLVVGAWLVGPWVIGFVSGGRFVIAPAMMAVITASAGLVACLCVTGPALLAERRHVPYVAGWVVAAVLTVGALLLPVSLDLGLSIALLAPPAIGLLVHLAALVLEASRDPRPT